MVQRAVISRPCEQGGGVSTARLLWGRRKEGAQHHFSEEGDGRTVESLGGRPQVPCGEMRDPDAGVGPQAGAAVLSPQRLLWMKQEPRVSLWAGLVHVFLGILF